MPEMNGIELTREIKRRCMENQIVMLISSTDWAEVEHDARDAGAARFLQKPLFPSSIVDCINACMNVRGEKAGGGFCEDVSEDGVFSGKRTLVAEDVRINREIFQALIEHTGLDMDFVEDGVEAVEKYSADPEGYDMILMDIQMPNMDGYAASREIRSSGRPGADAIPIIAMTANVFREDIDRCLAAGMNDHIGKPIDTPEVIAKLKRYLTS